MTAAHLNNANFSNTNLNNANFNNSYFINVKNLTPFQIKSACNWEKAFYKGHYNHENFQSIVDQQANQKYIEQLKQDKASDPKEPIDCSKWK